jgi:hypothetical protein
VPATRQRRKGKCSEGLTGARGGVDGGSACHSGADSGTSALVSSAHGKEEQR